MKLPSAKKLQVAGKRVLLRTDYDVPFRLSLPRARSRGSGQALQIADKTRIIKSLPTIKYLLKQKAEIIIISHLGRPALTWRGRPEGKKVPELSLKPVAEYLSTLLPDAKNCQLHENLRFDPGEEKNDQKFAKKLAGLADFYVNEAFAASHRKHASIVGIPQYLPSAFGFSFIETVKVLDKVRNNPKRPVTLILGGAKKDKLEQVDELAKWADHVLIGGKLPKIIRNLKLVIKNLLVAKLNAVGKDISAKSINDFIKIIGQSAVVVWSGPMGVFEEEKFATGTREVARATVNSEAFSVVGGGDTQAALKKLGFDGKMSYICSGGGAMLEFLAKGTLPGIEAVIKKSQLT